MSPVFIANWKMNKLVAEAREFCEKFSSLFQADDAEVGIAPPLTLLPTVARCFAETTGVMVGAQNVHWDQSGAHTGEVSPAMIKEQGAEFTIVGHSERRQFYGETNQTVAKRTKASLTAQLKTIVCLGESQSQFEASETEKVVSSQLQESLAGVTEDQCPNLLVAYEPIWAIGTGLAATPEIAGNVHNLIRSGLVGIYSQETAAKIPLLYGGSTKPGNISELISQPNIDGALVGGASLEAESFAQLIENGS